jgi:hypothetical protein
MIKQEKKKSFEKKRFEKKNHAQESKKRKHNKRTIDKSIVKKLSKQITKVISKKSFLFTTKTVIISNRIFNLISQFDDRARQLFDELKKVRRQYQAERMTRLIQSRHQTIDEMLRYEYDLDTSKRSIQIIISFTLININTQEILFILSHHVIISNITINAQTQKNAFVHVR